MRKNVKNRLLLTALVAGLGFAPAGWLPAQTFTTLYNFTETSTGPQWLNSDGSWPMAGLLLSSNVLYGTTSVGGSGGYGIMFAIKTDGTGFTNLHTFTDLRNSQDIYPKSGLVLADNIFYGIDNAGGSAVVTSFPWPGGIAGAGSVFAVHTDGTGFSSIHDFPGFAYPDGANSEGAFPSGSLILSGTTLYGTAAYGGSGGSGTLFSLSTSGSGFKTLYNFTTIDWPYHNTGGSTPKGGLVLSASGATLYGTASAGGTGGNYSVYNTGGTVYAVNTDGSGFTVLHSFNLSSSPGDGSSPQSGLVLSASGNTLYGTTKYGGGDGMGTVFAVNTDGSGYTILHQFSATTPGIGDWLTNQIPCFNTDGVFPLAGLVLSASGNTLYGTTSLGGGGGFGTVFSINTDGTDFTVLHDCAPATSNEAPNDGGDQPNKLLLSGHTLYGTAAAGGSHSQGTVFSIALGLLATVSATPTPVQIGDTIQVVVSARNLRDEPMTSVELAGPITVAGSGGVAAAGFSGATMVPTLAPGATAAFTYLYTATNDGRVSFTATCAGTASDGVVTSSPATSPTVLIACKGDLMVKTADPSDTMFSGVGEFQQAPPYNDQDVSLAVSSTGSAAYILRLQNDAPVAKSYVLRATTNNIPNWSVKVLAGNVSILGALIGANGWTAPSLAPGASLDIQVSLAPLSQAGEADNKWIQVTSMADSASTDVIDAVRLHATLVPVPVKVTINKVGPAGYTTDSIQAGTTDINAPLVPSLDPNVLDGNLAIIHGGLVADGVTPLVIKLEADADSIAQFPDGKDFLFQASYPSGGNSLAGAPIGQRLALLQNGAWQWATDVVLSASSPIAYVQLLPILSDDLLLTSLPPGVSVDFAVQDKTSGIQAGDVTFTLSKPPIALIHGYNTTGDWGGDFKTILGASRLFDEANANNFIVTVKYGQDVVPGFPTKLGLTVYENTVASLDACAQKALVAFDETLAPLHSSWAFTRFDVVAHSQGGVLSRMLCNLNGNEVISEPFRNAANCNRGRFHRVVTIGSPHNGSRILHYLLDLYLSAKLLALNSSLPQVVGALGVQSKIAQEKFDPFGPQFAELATPMWQPDPAASFHLVRTVIDGGASPGRSDSTPSYVALALNSILGGTSVIPRGADGVVDLDSMGGNVPPAAVAANVFTVPSANAISHAPPTFLFGATSFQTASTVVAQHVINALDQDSALPSGDIAFGPFPVPPLLDSSQETAIDAYAGTVTIEALAGALHVLPRALDGNTSYEYQILFPSNLPPAGDVTWFVQVYDSSGITSDGVELTASGTNNSQVTLTVDGGLVGDVVLSAVYSSGSNTVVSIPPTVVVSLPPSGATLTGFQLLPATIALPVGSVVSPQFLATYSDGSTSLRYAAPGAVAATTSQPSVVSVGDPLNWQLSAVGTARIDVSWSGFTAVAQVTVFDSTTNTPPTLSIQNNGFGQLTVAWPGFSTAYVLESNNVLQQTDAWQPVATAPIHAGGWTSVPLAATNAPQFFRLRWDPATIQF